jgi:hypothetical protein
VEINESGAANSWSLCEMGLLQKSLGQSAEAEATFQRALSMPPQMLAYHFIRMARASSR